MFIKYLKLTCLSLFVLLSLQSCFSDDEIKIGFSVHSYADERWMKEKDFFSKKIEDLGGVSIVKVAEGDAELQIKQCQELIAEGVKTLVVVAQSSVMAGEIVNLAHKSGVKVIAYDRLIQNSELDYYVSFDNIKVGELQAQYLLNKKPEGVYAIIGGDQNDNNAFQFRTGQYNVLKPREEKGKIQIVFDEMANAWSSDEGYNAMEKCLRQNGHIDAAVVASDGLMVGVLKSLRERGLEKKVLITGQDASLDAGKAILSGELAMTIYKPLEAIAYTAAITAMKVAKGEPVRNADRFVNNGTVDVPSILLSPTVVDGNNILSTIVADGYVKEEDLYGL